MTRLRLPGMRLHRVKAPTAHEVRPMLASDIDNVYGLYAAYATDQFGENYSYDRWGPGVPVPYDDLVEVPTQEVDPSLAVHARLTALMDESRGFVLLAERDGEVSGFLIASLLAASSFEHEKIGCIDDLYVVPGQRRQHIASQLVVAAVRRLRRNGALLLRVEFARENTCALRFWDAQAHWTTDVCTYHSYL